MNGDQDQGSQEVKVHAGEYLVIMQVLALFELTDLGDSLIVFKLVSYAGTALYFIYSYMRGLPNGVAIVTAAIDAFPGIGWVPLRMAGYTVAVLMANNPKIAAAVAGATALTGVTGAAGASKGVAAAEKGAGASATTAGAAPNTTSMTAQGTTAKTSTASAGSSASGVTTSPAGASAGGTTTAGGYSYSGPAGGAPTDAPISGAAQYAKDVQQEQDPLLQLNKQLTQQTPGTVDRPTGGRDDIAVNDDTNTVQLPYATN
jgi:hypothetical protein